MGSLTKRQKEQAKYISNADKTLTRLSIVVDSGACESVIDPQQVPSVSLVQTKESLSEEDSATGEPIPYRASCVYPWLPESTPTGE